MHYIIQELCLKNNQMSTEAPTTVIPTQNRVAIIVHLFYPDIWEEIQTYLQKLKIGFDLFISVPPNIGEQEILKIWDTIPSAHIYRTENRGRDVLPFLQIMHIIGTDTYQYICKIHTKKTGESDLGFIWRKLLYYDLIGSNEVVNDTLSLLDNDSTIGMVSGKNTILDSQRYTYGNAANVKYLSHQSGIVHEDFYLFPAGTMFWTRAEIITPMVKLLEEGKLDFSPEAGQIDNTIAHAIERFFGIIAHDRGYKIIESPAKYSHLSDETLDKVASLVLSQQYVGNNIFAMQKQKIEEQNKHITYLEKLADSMRMKNRLKHVISDKIKPLMKKIAKIPTKVMKVAKVIKNNPDLLKKVFYYAKRGELSYLITKIREKSTNNLDKTENLQEVNVEAYFRNWDENTYSYSGQPIDIIIPVYNGYEFLEALFDSVEKHTSIDYRLIVINDCSPDSHVKPYLLERLSKHPTAIFIDHTENQGFLKSVNEAYTHVENHFVLLNTDTEVPSFWLERLMYPILSMDNIASTTPFTNSGEIASFPNFVADNPIFDGMSVEDLDATFKTVNPEVFYAEVPTGVGFCMGVNYTLAQKIGMFAEDTFGKGYGEENDWCQRAIKEGYKNLIVPNLFVYHKHGGSFSAEEKQKLLEKNAITLLERHPNYGKDVNTYIEQNPHETLRHLLVLRASNTTHPIHLMFDHSLGGGANHYADKRLEQYLFEEKNILLVSYDFYSACYTLRHRYKEYDFSFKITEFEALTTFIDTLDITELFVNNLVSYKTPKKILTYLTHLAENKNIHTIVPIHDFYPLCPSYNLLNEKGHYCDVPSLERCKTCMLSNMQEWRNFYEEEVDVKAWRETWGTLLEKSTEILCFSHSSKEIFQKAYPNIDETKLYVIPHTVEGISPVVVQRESNKISKTIGVLGAINYVKGSSIIRQMVEIIERDNLDINIVVIGEITETIKSKHFHTTGRYNRDNLPQIIQEHQIDIFLIPSVCPETFSYTTHEIILMELPIMVFNLGAPAERVAKYDKGYIIDSVSASAVLEQINIT